MSDGGLLHELGVHLVELLWLAAAGLAVGARSGDEHLARVYVHEDVPPLGVALEDRVGRASHVALDVEEVEVVERRVGEAARQHIAQRRAHQQRHLCAKHRPRRFGQNGSEQV